MLINELNWDLSHLLKSTRVEWKTMSTLDLVNLANQLARMLHEPPKRNITKILNFWEFPGGPVVRTLSSHCQGPVFNP